MSTIPDHLMLWQNALTAHIEDCQNLRRVIVYPEATSTQDLARTFVDSPGTVVTVGRQTAGRGRRGSVWQDTGNDGVALSMVLPHWPDPALSLRLATAVADALQPLVDAPVMIKWPNDIWIDDRKVAGILIETTGDATIAGIGVNVTQSDWPDNLKRVAISLAQAGASAGRLEVIRSLLTAIDRWLTRTPAEVEAAFHARDALRGRIITANCRGKQVTGRVLAIDPATGLVLDGDGTRLIMDAAVTTIQSVDH